VDVYKESSYSSCNSTSFFSSISVFYVIGGGAAFLMNMIQGFGKRVFKWIAYLYLFNVYF